MQSGKDCNFSNSILSDKHFHDPNQSQVKVLW